MNNSTTHRGEIVERIVRRSGHSLSKLAKKLGISRNTLYNRFENADLSYAFISEVGRIIYYDFTIEFPEMKEDEVPLETDKTTELVRLEGKYTQLLEKYNKLLEMVVRATNANGLHDLRPELTQFLGKETPGC